MSNRTELNDFEIYASIPNNLLFLKQKYQKKSAKLSQQTSFTFLPSESYLDWMGNYYLKISKPDNALTLFLIAKTEYPNNSNAYLSLGKAYEKKGEKTLAKISFEKAIQLSPDNKETK